MILIKKLQILQEKVFQFYLLHLNFYVITAP